MVFSAADFEDFLEPRPDLPQSMEDELEPVVRHLVEQRDEQGRLIYHCLDGGAAVADELAWPWTGWSTPLWVVALAAAVVATLLGWLVIRRRKRRSRPQPS